MSEFWVVDFRFLVRGKEEDSRLKKARKREKKEDAQKSKTISMFDGVCSQLEED